MLAPRTRRTILQIIPFTIIWFIFCLVYLLIEKGLIGNLEYYPSTGNPYNFTKNALTLAATSLTIGTAFGALETFYIKDLFRNKSFTAKLIYKSLIYFSLMTFFLITNTVISNSINLDTHVFDRQTWNNVWTFFSHFAFWSVQIYIATIILITTFFSEVRDNLGQEVFFNFFTGKYHNPIQEERIFMFLDMKSSTTIAEKLGHVKYFKMLQSYYSDLSEPIVDYAGEIYQYVGDEIVLSWKIKDGLHENNFLRCFLAMRNSLQEKSEIYINEFGVAPTFKAGFHHGEVTTGEIGTIRQNIIFTGDVLNTAARIQGLCNTYDVDILISGKLAGEMKKYNEIELKYLGEAELRGRDEKVGLYTLIK